MGARDGMSPRFKDLARKSNRSWGASRVIVSMLRAESKAAQALERALAAVDLSLPQFNILMVLAAAPAGRLPIFELTGQLVTSAPNMSWLTTRMDERGLIRKNRYDGDRRVVIVEITESGWDLLGAAAPLVFDSERELLRGFSAADRRALGDLLERFLEGPA